MDVSENKTFNTLSTAMLQILRKYGTVAPGDTVVVGISGGPDSTALLHLLAHLRGELGVQIVAAHVEHGIRGEESREDEAFVARLCSQIDVPLRTRRISVPEIARQRGVSTQVAARDERHRFLRELASEVCAKGRERIALGHTRDDRCETVLLNILRGTGIDGLAAMPPVHLPIIRPLIDFSHADTVEYCVAHGLEARSDSSNTDPHYTRNRIRLELIPLIAGQYNQGIIDSLLRLSTIAADEREVMCELANKLYASVLVTENPSLVVLERRALSEAPVALQRRVIRIAVDIVRSGATDVDMNAVEAVVAALTGENRLCRMLPMLNGATQCLEVDDAHVYIGERNTILSVGSAWQIVINPSELYKVEAWRRMVSVRVVPAAEVAAFVEEISAQGSEGSLVFRRSDIDGELVLRTWMDSDRIKPKGMLGTKKLSDLYTDNKIDRFSRNNFPVLTTTGVEPRVLSVLGLRSDVTSLSAKELINIAATDPDTELVVVHWRPY